MKAPSKGFQTPAEVVDYFRDKSLRPAFSWLDVWGEEHAYAFTVAKAVDAELLATFKASIGKAIAEGQGFETWRQDLLPELQRLGWAGKRKVQDPTGAWKAKEVDFTAPRRLETIFWSNVRAARAAGQWERIQRTKAGLPYLLYVRTTSSEPRKEHLAWAGLVLPVDDPFWNTHFPPNGWGCKCSVRQITRREADRLVAGGGHATAAPDLGESAFQNRRTGEVVSVPNGVDPGWATNPGLARARTLVDNLQARLEQAGPQAARDKIAEIMASPAPRVMMGRDERLRLPVAVAEDIARALGAISPIVMASNDAIAIKTGRHDVTLDDFAAAQAHVDKGETIDEGQTDKRSIYWEKGDRLLKMIVQKSAGGFLRIATLFSTNRRNLAAARRKAAAHAKKKAEE